MRAYLLALLLAQVGLNSSARAQSPVDADLAKEIEQIRPIDNHSHDDPVYAARTDLWTDDRPLGEAPYPDVAPLRRDNPAWIAAWRALYGYRYNDMEPEHLRQLLRTKQSLMRTMGEHWPEWVLDKARIDVALVNAPRLGPGQNGARFRLVPFADPLLRPFESDRSWLQYPGGPSTLSGLLEEADQPAVPRSLTGYEDRVIKATLARWKREGVPAIKFLSAYVRHLDFIPVERSKADAIFAKAVSGTPLDRSEIKLLEDYLFNAICEQAGAVGLVVHIHTGNGNGPYFDNGGADPALLEPAINSGALRRTKFVLLHGGWPYHRTAQAMMDKPNTYADFSAETFYLTPHALADVLRGWLEWHPEKVLFGTDAYSDRNTPLSDYEEKGWLVTRNAKQALGIALTAMMRDHEITPARAKEIARMVLRENAIRVYALQ